MNALYEITVNIFTADSTWPQPRPCPDYSLL